MRALVVFSIAGGLSSLSSIFACEPISDPPRDGGAIEASDEVPDASERVGELDAGELTATPETRK